MGRTLLFSLLCFFFYTVSLFCPVSATSSCPMDLSYVKTVPWDTSLCHRDKKGNCCSTLLSLFGIGIAQHLKETSLFQLPNLNVSASCLSDFQEQLAALSIDPTVVPRCFPDPGLFVSNASRCDGIITTQDWVKRVGSTTQLDIGCKGDFSELTRCGLCLAAGQQVNTLLTSLDPKANSKCFDFVCLYAAGIVSDSGPSDDSTASCTLRLPLATPKAKKPENSRDRLLEVLLASLGGLTVVLLAFALVAWYLKRHRKSKQNAYARSFTDSLLPHSGAKCFHFSELEQATDGFSQRNFLGRGGFGVVYKGRLEDGTLVAVKRMNDLDSQGDEEFSNEVEIICKIRHRNLLSLRGCCVARDEFNGKSRYIVYDFMSNGSLGDYLYNDHKRKLLTWPLRKNIILDVANGLTYLHNGVKPAIYHRDIKATNILLDMDMKAKVADFGLAKQSLDGRSHVTTRVAGTHGYLAPEYALYGQLTEKSDVYSFGIVTLEILSGRKALDISDSSPVLITDWVWEQAKSRSMEEVFDDTIKEQGPRGIMERFVHVGLLCAHMTMAFRPTISDALKMLEGDIDIPELPDRPLPLSHESLRHFWNSISTDDEDTSGRNRSTSYMI